VPLELLSPDAAGEKDARADPKALAPWVDDARDSTDTSCNMPPVFSTQLEDWMLFRQRWQWDNRDKAAGRDGFPAYLAWQRGVHLHQGEVRVVSDPFFETTTRRIWDHEPAPREVPHGAGFEA
jgi:hypothetical protein